MTCDLQLYSILCDVCQFIVFNVNIVTVSDAKWYFCGSQHRRCLLATFLD